MSRASDELNGHTCFHILYTHTDTQIYLLPLSLSETLSSCFCSFNGTIEKIYYLVQVAPYFVHLHLDTTLLLS